MRRVIVTTFVTLDGVQEHPEEWQLRFVDEEAMKHIREDLFGNDALVMGRETYEGYAAV